MLSLPDNRSTRPYLIRAMFEWCVDHGFTPYLVVMVDKSVLVPQEFVKNGEIVLNISPEATGNLTLGNEWIEFKARFGGVPRDIVVPVERVIAIYSKENGQGMAFPKPLESDRPSATKTPAPSVAAPSKADKSPWLQVVPTKAASTSADSSTAQSTQPILNEPQSTESPSTLGEGGQQRATQPEDDSTPPPSGGEGKTHLKRIK
jgi:stringent starvation protein B